MAPSTSQNLFFIDSQVLNLQTLVDSLPENSAWYQLNVASDGVNQIVKVLEDYQGLDSIQIFSHGTSGSLSLGNMQLSNDNLDLYQGQLEAIGNSLSDTGDILFYGCNVAAGDGGEAFVAALAEISGADVAASDDVTGPMSQGADWELEEHTGNIETQPIRVAETYQNTLQSEAVIEVNGKSYTVPIIYPFIFATQTPQTVAERFYVKENNVIVDLPQETIADLMAASQSIWILQNQDYGDTTSDLWDSLVLANNRLVQLEENIKSEPYVENTANFLFMVGAAAFGAAYIASGPIGWVSIALFGGSVLALGAETYFELSDADKKVAALDIANISIIEAMNGLNSFSNASYANIYSETTPSYTLTEIKQAISSATRSESEIYFADLFGTYLAAEEDRMDWVDTWLDAVGVISFPLSNALQAAVVVENFFSVTVAAVNASGTAEELEVALSNMISGLGSGYTDPFNAGYDYTNALDAASLFTTQGTSVADVMRVDDPNGGMLDALAGSDTLISGVGNDILKGGSDPDTYQFTGRWGQDVIIDNENGNRIQIFDKNFSSLSFSKSGTDLQIKNNINSTDSIVIQGFFNNTATTKSAITFDSWLIIANGSSYGSQDIINAMSWEDGQIVESPIRNPGDGIPWELFENENISINTSVIENIHQGDVLRLGDIVSITNFTNIPNTDNPSSIVSTDLSKIWLVDLSENDISSYEIRWFPDFNFADNPLEELNEYLEDTTITAGTAGETVTYEFFLDSNDDNQKESQIAYSRFSINPLPNNLAPVVNVSSQTTSSSSEYIPVFTATDANGIVDIQISISSAPGSGKLTYLDQDYGLNETVHLSLAAYQSGALVFDGASKSETYSFSVSASDYELTSAPVSFSINVTNSAPVLSGDNFIASENEPLTFSSQELIGNDDDPDDDSLTVTSVGIPSHGTATLSNGLVVYTPASSWLGNDSFSYSVTDGTASVSSTVSVLTVAKPEVVADSGLTSTGQSVTINVLSNDTAPVDTRLMIGSVTQSAHGSITITEDASAVIYTPFDGYAGDDSFTYFVTTSEGATDFADVFISVEGETNNPPTAANDSYEVDENTPLLVNGISLSSIINNDNDPDGNSLTLNTTPIIDVTHGELTLNPDGTFTYTPTTNFNGSDSFVYEVSDSNGGTDQATVNLTVNAVNDAPQAVNDSVITAEDTAVVIAALANDSDPEDDTLTINSVNQGQNGAVVINTDGTFTYTPTSNFNGSDSFVYQISDGNGGTDQATVNITVNAVNDAPHAVNDSVTTAEDTAVVIAALANDSDPEDNILIIDSVTQGQNGAVVINTDGTVSYTPEGNFFGIDSFDYTINDGNNGTASATVYISVGVVNDVPQATNDVYTTDEDVAIVIASSTLPALLDNDSDLDDDNLTVNTIPITDVEHGALTLNIDGSFTYTPTSNYNGSDSFVYEVSDGVGGTDQATVNITVNAVNDAPQANNDSATTSKDTAVTIGVLTNDIDVDGDVLSFASITNQNHGVVRIAEDNCLIYTPDVGFSGSGSFIYTIEDGSGATSSAQVNISILTTVPVWTGNIVLDGEPEVGGMVTATISDVSGMEISGQWLNNGVPILGSDVYVAVPDVGSATMNYRFAYTVKDDDLGDNISFWFSSPDTDGTNISYVSEPLEIVAGDHEAEGDLLVHGLGQEGGILEAVLANASDVDGITNLNYQWQIEQDGEWRNVFGATSSNYAIASDQSEVGKSIRVVVTTLDLIGGITVFSGEAINIANINDSPEGVITVDGNATAGNIINAGTGGIVDEDGLGILNYQWLRNGVVIPDATYDTYFLNQTDVGTTIGVRVSYTDLYDTDEVLYSDEIEVVATVNYAPQAINDHFTLFQDTLGVVDVLGNDIGMNGETITITGVTQGEHGTANINSDNTITYLPDYNFTGTDTFGYTISAGNDLTDSATVNLTIRSSDGDNLQTDQNGDFDEGFYLLNNPDVAAAVAGGVFSSGWAHYVDFGQAEGRSYSSPAEYGDFDEGFYLLNNPDVAAAVAGGVFTSGWAHYVDFGQAEGRSYSSPTEYGDFDEEFYLLNNPDVAAAVAGGVFSSGWEHYVDFGQAEGRASVDQTLLSNQAGVSALSFVENTLDNIYDENLDIGLLGIVSATIYADDMS